MLLPRISNGLPLVASNAPALSDDPCTCCGTIDCPCKSQTVIAVVSGVYAPGGCRCNIMNGAFVLQYTGTCEWTFTDEVDLACFGSGVSTIVRRELLYTIENPAGGLRRASGGFAVIRGSAYETLFNGQSEYTSALCPSLHLNGMSGGVFGKWFYCWADGGTMDVTPA